MQYLKQSTASQSVVIGPFVDSTDGNTAETGLTIANTDIRLSKNGGNIASKNSGGGTHDELGYYTITLDATDTDTVGRLQLAVHVAGALPVYHEFQVLEEAVYDALFAASAVGPLLANSNGSGLTEAGGTGDHLTAVPWNASWDAEVESEVNDALVALHLDHLLAADYDPAAKPGVATALLNELVESDAGVSRFTANALEQAPTGGSAPTAAQIADAVWTEILADHSGVTGSTAEALAAAGSAGDPWATQLPGAYGAGSAGKIIGDNVNAAISSRASQTSLDTVDGIVDNILLDTNELQTDWANGGRLDLLLDATLADTNELQTDWANGGRLDLILDARASQSSVDTIDGIVDAILLDTGTDGVVVAAGSKSGYSLAATGLDLVVPAEPSAIPVLGTSSIVAWQGFFAAWSVNEVNTTSTQAKLRNSADTADLATHAISDDGTTFISGEPT